MWTPYFFFDQFTIEDSDSPSLLLESMRDSTEREFYVHFLLYDARLARKEIHLQVSDSMKSFRFSDRSKRTVRGIFTSNERGRLDGIGLVFSENSLLPALWYAFNRVSELISYWSLANGGSISVWGVRVYDSKYKAKFRSMPDVPMETIEPPPLFVPSSINLDDVHKKMVGLYREARSSTSPFYGLLCSYKILEGVLQHQMFKETDLRIRELRLKDGKRRQGKITNGMLQVASAHYRYAQLEGMKFSAFRQTVVRPVRDTIAHAIMDVGAMLDVDNINDNIETTILASLTDLVAREVLMEEFRLLDIIAQSVSGDNRPREPYIDPDRFTYLRMTPQGEIYSEWFDAGK